MLPCDTFTRMSESWRSTSWLDHCLSSLDGHHSICDMAVLYETSCGDHVPFKMDINTDHIPEPDTGDAVSVAKRVD